MPSITRADVAHLARLSRLALSDDELDQMAGQLEVIISSVARVSEVAGARCAAHVAFGAVDERVSPRRTATVPDARSCTLRRARSRGPALPGASDPGRGVVR